MPGRAYGLVEERKGIWGLHSVHLDPERYLLCSKCAVRTIFTPGIRIPAGRGAHVDLTGQRIDVLPG